MAGIKIPTIELSQLTVDQETYIRDMEKQMYESKLHPDCICTVGGSKNGPLCPIHNRPT